jgi:hypothetical protein
MFAQRFDAAYLNELIHFVKTIQDDLQAEPGLSEGKVALKIGLAAFKSTKIGTAVQVECR